jgi:hypothetical protein
LHEDDDDEDVNERNNDVDKIVDDVDGDEDNKG